MAIRELTCISCPLGCPLKVETDENGAVLQVTGNTCKRGAIRAAKIQAPVHIGDVVVENVCGTGVDVIATKTVD